MIVVKTINSFENKDTPILVSPFFDKDKVCKIYVVSSTGVSGDFGILISGNYVYRNFPVLAGQTVVISDFHLAAFEEISVVGSSNIIFRIVYLDYSNINESFSTLSGIEEKLSILSNIEEKLSTLSGIEEKLSILSNIEEKISILNTI
jgi:hypothetical protein